MTETLKDKVAKVYQLVNHGATEGERNAAKNILTQLLKKHNIDEAQLSSLLLNEYVFKYSTKQDLILLQQLMKLLVPTAFENSKRTNFYKGVRGKFIVSRLTYSDFITLDCNYQYYRLHMTTEWKKICLPQINKYKKVASKVATRNVLLPLFINDYFIKSGLYLPETLKKVTITNKKEIQHHELMKQVSGGKYHTQVATSLRLS